MGHAYFPFKSQREFIFIQKCFYFSGHKKLCVVVVPFYTKFAARVVVFCVDVPVSIILDYIGFGVFSNPEKYGHSAIHVTMLYTVPKHYEYSFCSIVQRTLQGPQWLITLLSFCT